MASMFGFHLTSLVLLLGVVISVQPSDAYDDLTCKIGSVGTCSIRRNCGLPKLTPDQRRCLSSKETTEKLRELNITGPMVVEDFKFVELTPEQETQLEECYGGSLFKPLAEEAQTRRKRQTGRLPCCRAQNPFVLLTHTKDTLGRTVEIVQMTTSGQAFEHENGSFCRGKRVCDTGLPGATCDTDQIPVTAAVVVLESQGPPDFGITTIMVDTCRTFPEL